MPRENNCHCEEHSGLDRKSEINCESIKIAHARIDKCLPRSAFQWTFGILIGALIMMCGYGAASLDSIHEDVVAIDKQLAIVMTSLRSIEKRNDKKDTQQNRKNGYNQRTNNN